MLQSTANKCPCVFKYGYHLGKGSGYQRLKKLETGTSKRESEVICFLSGISSAIEFEVDEDGRKMGVTTHAEGGILPFNKTTVKLFQIH